MPRRQELTRTVNKVVQTSRYVTPWDADRSPDAIQATTADPLGVKTLTLSIYDEAPLARAAEAAYTRDSAPRKAAKRPPGPREVYIRKFIERTGSKATIAMLICEDYELLLAQRQARVTFEVIFQQADDHFRAAFLLDPLPQVPEGLKLTPESTSNEGYMEMAAKYPKGPELVGTMLKKMANLICPRLLAYFSSPV